jgi:hypothetical protein
MTIAWVVAIVVVSATVSGCGAIVEVPVASTSESSGTEGQSDGQSESPSGDERGTETSASSTEGETEHPDVDGASGSGTTGDGGPGDDGDEGPLASLSFCDVLEDPLDVPEDGSWAEAAIDVPARQTASMLAVTLRLTHPRVSDLRIRLRAPDGTLASLLDEPACDQPNIDAMFEDGAEQLGNEVCHADGIAAIHGSVAAIDELAPLLRAPVGGRWALELTDAVPGEQGMLDQACVVLTVEGR